MEWKVLICKFKSGCQDAEKTNLVRTKIDIKKQHTKSKENNLILHKMRDLQQHSSRDNTWPEYELVR